MITFFLHFGKLHIFLALTQIPEIESLGGHLYFRLDIIRVKGLSKHTLNSYFSCMKIDPKYVFLLRVFFLINGQKHTLFSNFARFCTPKRCTRVHCLVLKNNPNYVNFFTRMISNLKYKWPPPGIDFICYTPLTAHNWQKWIRVFLTWTCHEIYRDEAVCLKSCKYTYNICENVKFGAILWKFDILSITA